MALELIPLCNATVSLAPPIIVGTTPSGSRMIFEVNEVRFEGERLKGSMKGAAGADWLVVSADGAVGTLDVRVTIETDDGALVYAHYYGRTDTSAGPGASPIYTAPLFETGDERYAWLNRILAVAKGEISADLSTLVYEMYELR